MRLRMVKIKKTDAKFFIGQKDNEKIILLCIKLLKTNGHVNSFKETKYISFEIKMNELLEKFNEIWDNVSNIIEKAFYVQLFFEEKYLKSKLKYYNGKKHIFSVKSTRRKC